MANHTAAERERINKRHNRQRWIMEGIFAAAIAVFVVCAVLINKKNAELEKAALSVPTEDPAISDERVIYLRNFAEGGFSLDDKAARLAFNDSNGSQAQLVTYHKDGLLCVKYVFSPQITAAENDDSDIFSGITEDTAAPSVGHSDVAEEAAGYFVPLIGNEYRDTIVRGISAALSDAQGGKSFKRSFIAGIYSVAVEFSAADGLMTLCAEPT